MLGIAVIRHSILQVFGNFADALKVSLVLWIISSVVSTLVFQWAVEDMSLVSAFSQSAQLLMWVISLFSIFIAALIAVSWHRFVLNNERPTGWVPKMPVNLAFSYIWKLIVIGLLLLLMFIPLVLIMTLVVFSTSSVSVGDLGVVILVGLIAGVLATYVFLRLSVLLPTAALGNKMSIKEAWQATSKIGGGLWSVVILLVIINAALQFFGGWLYSVPGGTIIASIYGWFSMMLSVSLITTIYGVCVEDRDLI